MANPSAIASTATAKDIYDKMFNGEYVFVHCTNEKDFQSLRVAIAKQHSVMKEADLTAKMMHSRCDLPISQATFFLRAPSNLTGYQIEEEQNGQ